jgi:hypothetical protein
MQNIVLFNVTHNEPITIKHNGVVVDSNELECVYGVNELTIEGIDYVVNDLSMFNMGNGEIVKHATNENGVWTLKYEYPVFSWLHKILNHGWLLKEDNE